MKINFLGIPVDTFTMKETIELVDKSIAENKHIQHVVINASKVVSMLNDKVLFDSVVNCDIINADGQSIVWAAKFLGKKIQERVAGADLMPKLVELAYKKKYKCFFFGAKEEVVKKVVEKYSREYAPGIVAGYRNGYYTKEEEPAIAKLISDSGAQLLFVAMSSPNKEKFLYKYSDMLRNVNFTMGVGGTFDVVAGVTKRAPLWMQNSGLEWFFRLIQEPRRMWYRYLVGNTKFIFLVFREKFRKMR
jgi:N-acetylglucosaminyldiphosphoundecaprenol N-acetyl-beta-D-mannosaminyltransferase